MIYFFTYGDDKFTNTKKRIELEAHSFKLFDEIKIYGREDIDVDFINMTKPYIDIRGGYWLWKSLFLKKTFDRINDGDYVIYADAGCTINSLGVERFKYYLELIDLEDTGIFRFSYSAPECMFTNQKVFEFFGKLEDTDFQNTNHLIATVLIFKKNKNSTDFIDKYYEIACNKPELFSDDFNDYKRIRIFKDHRQDQSVSSCLAKLYKVTILEDETYAPDLDGWMELIYKKKIPFLATRIRN